ncbi:MAG: hypothetical protein QXP39_00080 [Candidatus Aenigmatarchaeota archaeon]
MDFDEEEFKEFKAMLLSQAGVYSVGLGENEKGEYTITIYAEKDVPVEIPIRPRSLKKYPVKIIRGEPIEAKK